MKKIEFLRELEEQLMILNDNERRDILEEYEQHIDLKISAGMLEEAATTDFGNMTELVDNILSAYNVNLNYNKSKDKVKIKVRMENLFKKVWSHLKNGCKKIGNRCKKINKGIKNTFLSLCISFKNCFNKSNHNLKKLNNNIKNLFRKNREKNMEKTNEKDSIKEATTQGIEISRENKKWSIINKMGTTIKNLFIWFYKLFIVVVELPVLFISVLLIISFGCFVVLLFNRFPVIGILFMLIGSIVNALGILLILFYLLVPIKRYYKVILSSMGIGLLFFGIGIGIAFIEFSQFTYGGEICISEQEVKTDINTFDIPPEGEVLCFLYGANGVRDIIADKTIPIDKIVFETTYNKNEMTVGIYYDEQEQYFAYETMYINNKVGLNFIKMKDLFLKQLNEKVIYEIIDDTYFVTTTIKVAPENFERIVNEENYYENEIENEMEDELEDELEYDIEDELEKDNLKLKIS